MTGAAGFAVGIGIFFIFGPDWAVAALTATPAPLAALVMGVAVRAWRRGVCRRFRQRSRRRANAVIPLRAQ